MMLGMVEYLLECGLHKQIGVTGFIDTGNDAGTAVKQENKLLECALILCCGITYRLWKPDKDVIDLRGQYAKPAMQFSRRSHKRMAKCHNLLLHEGKEVRLWLDQVEMQHHGLLPNEAMQLFQTWPRVWCLQGLWIWPLLAWHYQYLNHVNLYADATLMCMFHVYHPGISFFMHAWHNVGYICYSFSQYSFSICC